MTSMADLRTSALSRDILAEMGKYFHAGGVGSTKLCPLSWDAKTLTTEGTAGAQGQLLRKHKVSPQDPKQRLGYGSFCAFANSWAAWYIRTTSFLALGWRAMSLVVKLEDDLGERSEWGSTWTVVIPARRR